MMNAELIIATAAALLVLAAYVVIPRTRYAPHRANILRGIIFFSIIAYLGIEFFRKEQYRYFAFLALGCIAFVWALRNMRK